MEVVISAPRSELGRVLKRAVNSAPQKPETGARTVLINLLVQPPNSLLHDGHLWQRYPPGRMVADTRRLLDDSSHRGCDLIVHASYAFLRAVEAGATPGPRLRPIVEAALEVEQMVLADPRPSCVLRLGYLYGPESNDLKLYRMAFFLGRPYWAGPRRSLHDHLHHADAANALLQAASRPPKARVTYASDGHPASFQALMDHFARKVGNPVPLHLPRLSRAFAHAVVSEEHMQAVELGVAGAAGPKLPGFTPVFPDYRAGIADVIGAWR